MAPRRAPPPRVETWQQRTWPGTWGAVVRGAAVWASPPRGGPRPGPVPVARPPPARGRFGVGGRSGAEPDLDGPASPEQIRAQVVLGGETSPAHACTRMLVCALTHMTRTLTQHTLTHARSPSPRPTLGVSVPAFKPDGPPAPSRNDCESFRGCRYVRDAMLTPEAPPSSRPLSLFPGGLAGV